jgi:hypothetical protein
MTHVELMTEPEIGCISDIEENKVFQRDLCSDSREAKGGSRSDLRQRRERTMRPFSPRCGAEPINKSQTAASLRKTTDLE